MELGVYTFVENVRSTATGEMVSPEQRMANLLEEIELADQTGLDVFGVGEHHRPDFLVSSPATVLAAAAARTKSIRLTSAVTVLSSDDPVRVFQQFAIVDLISHGRAEIMAGRGSFIESYPLFGYNLNQYDELFSEKLDLLLTLTKEEKPFWSGKTRPSLNGQGVYPRPIQDPLPLWIAVGGTPQSIVRAGSLGLPVALAIIGGEPARFKPFIDLYREAARRSGHDPGKLPVGINSHGFIADSADAAATLAFPASADVMGRLGKERGWGPYTRAQFDASRAPRGADFVGDPQAVIDKILAQHEIFRHQRCLLQFSVGPIPHKDMLRSIELYGTVVAPAVRKALPSPT
jgi:probable LLM family oxidoreductase